MNFIVGREGKCEHRAWPQLSAAGHAQRVVRVLRSDCREYGFRVRCAVPGARGATAGDDRSGGDGCN